jgi:sugar phosphate isomerase/epimerase
MKLGFAGFEFINHQRRNRYFSSGRPIANTSGRPHQFYTRAEQPKVDMDDPLGWFGNLLAKHAITLSLDYGDDFTAPAKQPEDFRPFAKAAKHLGVYAIGLGGVPFSMNRFTEDPPLEGQMAMIRAQVEPLARIAEEEGVKLAYENHADYRVVELLKYLVEPIGSPALGIKLDTGNCPLVIEEASEAAEAAAHVIYATHFKEMFISPVTPDGGKIVGAPLGRGHLKLDQVAKTLHEKAPNPDDLILAIEIGWMPPNEDYFEWLADSVAWCRSALAPYLSPL